MALGIEFRSVTKAFPGAVPVIDGLSLKVAPGTLLALVGPSGCGKTTSLKMVNRLIEPSSGAIYLGDRAIATIPVNDLRRMIGYVIQYIGLFPHMTVAQNIAIVPKLLGWPRDKIRARVDELLTLVGLPPQAHRGRYPRTLSGGQQQRVGVARALAADPPVLLMDEPFGALDPVTRIRLQDELKSIQVKLHKTVLIVTHDMDEAIRLGDQVAILRAGRLVQIDTPANILRRPADDFVSDLLGADRLIKLLSTVSVGSVMSADPAPDGAPGIAAEATLERAFLEMLDSGRDALSVGGGSLHLRDLLKVRIGQ
jgi:osmoprotectant transport system ATP-binding protein